MMSESSKHTPGPWNTGGSVHAKVVYAQCVPIARTDAGDSYDWLPGKRFLYEETANANARLIAAGPELLEACKRLLKFVEKTGKHPITISGQPTCIELGIDAIAKAEGAE